MTELQCWYGVVKISTNPAFNPSVSLPVYKLQTRCLAEILGYALVWVYERRRERNSVIMRMIEHLQLIKGLCGDEKYRRRILCTIVQPAQRKLLTFVRELPTATLP
uniref:Uncharacterized protein n=1 Tax=Micrurus spixii TaxID=129469 RepID=A0A2D4MFX9_9SAUR